MNKIVIGIVVLIFGIVSFLAFTRESPESIEGGTDINYEILTQWNLPEELNEISGISWIGKNRIACVQDEDGIIFIYNLATSTVENSISFGPNGDYEGITITGENAYVLRSDGVIFEISNFESEEKNVQTFKTKLQDLKGINIEGLSADTKNNRLLLAVKERKALSNQKEIFSFDLDKKNTGNEAFFSIDPSDPIFSGIKGKVKSKFSPGGIALHPQTGELYILDGTNPKILVTGKDGTLKKLLMLKSNDFANPEGLTFSPEGDIYISNEAAGAPANILKISFNK